MESAEGRSADEDLGHQADADPAAQEERSIAVDVVERSTTMLFLDAVRDARLLMAVASVSCVAWPPYS